MYWGDAVRGCEYEIWVLSVVLVASSSGYWRSIWGGSESSTSMDMFLCSEEFQFFLSNMKPTTTSRRWRALVGREDSGGVIEDRGV